jgi:hypothetical protein
MVENEIATFTFDGKPLTKTVPIAMKVSPAGIRTAESWAAFATRRRVIPAALGAWFRNRIRRRLGHI